MCWLEIPVSGLRLEFLENFVVSNIIYFSFKILNNLFPKIQISKCTDITNIANKLCWVLLTTSIPPFESYLHLSTWMVSIGWEGEGRRVGENRKQESRREGVSCKAAWKTSLLRKGEGEGTRAWIHWFVSIRDQAWFEDIFLHRSRKKTFTKNIIFDISYFLIFPHTTKPMRERERGSGRRNYLDINLYRQVSPGGGRMNW